MTSRVLAMVLLLALVAFACGKREEQPPVATRAASPAPGVAATDAPAVASSPEATTTTPPQPAGTAAPAVSPATPSLATGAPTAPVTTQATQPQAPPPPAMTSAPPPMTNAEKPAAQRPKGEITLPAKLGDVTFDHEDHAGKRRIACTTCHHPSRPQKPLASENQACRDCHTMPAAPPMKTSLQAAFHDPKGGGGTCIDCHKKHAASTKDGSAPVKCLDCHKRKG